MPESRLEEGSFYTAQQAIARLGLSRTGFYQWVKQGRITRIPRRGRALGVYDRVQIDALAEALEHEARAQLARTNEQLQRSAQEHWKTAPPSDKLYQRPGRVNRSAEHSVNDPAVTQLQSLPGAEVLWQNLLHRALAEYLGASVFAPLSAPAAILDARCGSGRWAQEMAQRYPHARVVGVDHQSPPASSGRVIGAWSAMRALRAADLDELAAREEAEMRANMWSDEWEGAYLLDETTAPPPSLAWTYFPGDVLADTPFGDGVFDLVHQRFAAPTIEVTRWPLVLAALARLTRPGGWVELVEFSPATGGGLAHERLISWERVLLAESVQLDANALDASLRQAGLVNTHARAVWVPLDGGGDHTTLYMAIAHFLRLESLCERVVAAGITTRDRYLVTLEQAKTESVQYGSSWPFFIGAGQKPLVSENMPLHS